jgi:hypothetical protein
MRWLHSRWRHFWFEPTPPVNLGICRALCYGGLFLSFLGHDFSAWAEVSGVFWQPIWLLRRLHLPMLPGEMLDLLQLLWKAALGLCCIGLWTRFSTFIAFLLGVYLLGLPRSFGGISHTDCLLVFILGSWPFPGAATVARSMHWSGRCDVAAIQPASTRNSAASIRGRSGWSGS